ncbi:hypothetical protein KKF82_05440 [Patescibacteria group bacterium]|nr:hypothetical protein [Patescibacteria group bacterium]
MSESKDVVLMIGGLALGGWLLKEILFTTPNEEEKKLLDKINKHIQNAIDESNLALEDLETADTFFNYLIEKYEITDEDSEEFIALLSKVEEHIENSIVEKEQALVDTEELRDKFGNESVYEQVKELIIELGTEFISRVAPYVVTATIFIGIFKGRHILGNFLLKRKGGGGNPEAPIPEVQVVPYEIVNPVTRVPDNIINDYNPIWDPEPTEIYYHFPIDTPIEDIPPVTQHEQETIDNWKEIWTVVELLSYETKQLLYERLPSPLNESIYYSWEELPLAFGALFGSPLISATSWHEVSRKGEFGKFAVACSVILSAAVLVGVLIAIGLLTTSAGVPAAIAGVIAALGAGVGAIAA